MSLDQSKHVTCYSPIRLLALAGLVLPGYFGVEASAQVQNLRGQAGAVSRTDPYGNARSTYLERRRIGSFMNDVQREATRGYQGSGRRLNRRGGYADFVLGGDLFRPRRSSPLRYPYPGAAVPAVIRRTYAQYGGFERREAGAPAGDIESAIMRRWNLLDATSLNAPVHRARVAHGVGMSARAIVEEPFSAQREPSELGVEALSLDVRLLKQINRFLCIFD